MKILWDPKSKKQSHKIYAFSEMRVRWWPQLIFGVWTWFASHIFQNLWCWKSLYAVRKARLFLAFSLVSSRKTKTIWLQNYSAVFIKSAPRFYSRFNLWEIQLWNYLFLTNYVTNLCKLIEIFNLEIFIIYTKCVPKSKYLGNIMVWAVGASSWETVSSSVNEITEQKSESLWNIFLSISGGCEKFMFILYQTKNKLFFISERAFAPKGYPTFRG